MTSVEVTRAQLKGIKTAWTVTCVSLVRRLCRSRRFGEAETADAEIAAGRYRGPLHGVPLGMKDLFWTKGVAAAAGTTIHRDSGRKRMQRPSPA